MQKRIFSTDWIYHMPDHAPYRFDGARGRDLNPHKYIAQPQQEYLQNVCLKSELESVSFHMCGNTLKYLENKVRNKIK